MSKEELTPEEAFVERVKSARRGGVVLKARLISLRSDLPDAIVLAFEGDDDKVVYGQWIRRIRPALRYEPFPCGGKKEARELKNALGRDLGHLSDKVFFLVDRDYDDLIGFASIDSVFATDTYAVENYLVADDVLEELLRDEFPCHARPDVRRQIVQIFGKDYSDFLQITASINKRLYIARRVPIGLAKRLPTSLRHLAIVRIGKIDAVTTLPEDVVVFEREPTQEEVAELQEAFDKLDPKQRYRGKFAIKFFREWLDRLADAYLPDGSEAFGLHLPGGVVRRAEFVLSNFASKSRFPAGLSDFINSIE
jgi:Protein of unknown function (DUF4435)